MRSHRSSLAAVILSVALVAPPIHAASPLPTITRAGAVAIIVESHPSLRARAHQLDRRMPPIPLFADVDKRLWYAPYIEAGFEGGIVTATPSRRFRPGQVLTIEEAIAFAVRLKEYADPGARARVALQPRQYSSWYSEAITLAQVYRIALPSRIYLGQPVARHEFHAMLVSVGVRDPQLIAISIDPRRGLPPLPAPVIAAASQRPTLPSSRPIVAAQPRPATPPAPTSRPVQPQPEQPSSSVPNASSKFFAITMPSLGIQDLAINHPTDAVTSQGLLAPLKHGVGHLFSYPGRGGKILVYGHSSSVAYDLSPFTKIFRQINRLAIGDRVYITYDGKLYVYQVTNKRAVPAKDMSAYQGGNGEELILYTCWPPDDISQRYQVFARPVETIALR